MSNTDGEDTQRIEQAGEDYIRSIGKDPDIMWSGDVYNAGAAFIAGQDSLREQLAKLTNECEHHAKRQYHLENYYNEQLKQQEEVIRELIPIAQWGVPGFSQRLWNVTGDSSIVEMNKANAVINKAKSLITKNK